MQSVLVAETAVLVHLKSVGVVLFVLHGVVVALLTLGASQGNFDSHVGTSYSYKAGYCEPPSRPKAYRGCAQKWAQKINPFPRYLKLYHICQCRSSVFRKFFDYFLCGLYVVF